MWSGVNYVLASKTTLKLEVCSKESGVWFKLVDNIQPHCFWPSLPLRVARIQCCSDSNWGKIICMQSFKNKQLWQMVEHPGTQRLLGSIFHSPHSLCGRPAVLFLCFFSLHGFGRHLEISCFIHFYNACAEINKQQETGTQFSNNICIFA